MRASRNSQIPWSLLNITKTLLTSALVLLPLIDLVWLVLYEGQDDNTVERVHFVADTVRIITYSAVLGLQKLCQVGCDLLI